MANQVSGSRYWDRWWRKRITRRRALVGGSAIALGAAGLALVGCGEDEEEAPPPAAATPTGTAAAATPEAGVPAEEPVVGGVLPLAGWSGGYTSWDPRTGDEWDPSSYYTFTNDRLLEFRYGPPRADHPEPVEIDYTPTASLAESWEQPDDTTLIMAIRQGVKWWDVDPVNGREFVAADAVFSFEQYRSPDASFAESLKPIISVEAPDNYSLTIKTDAPYAPLVITIATPKFPMLAPEAVAKFGTLGSPDTIVGTGPWFLETYQEGIRARFARNPNYWRGPNGVTGEGLPYVDIEAALDPEWETTMAQFRSGELASGGAWFGFWSLEGTDKKDIDELAAAVSGMQQSLHPRPYMDRAIALRTDIPPFNDVRVRQAVSMSIDRAAWAESVYQGRQFGGREFSEPNPWFLPNDQLGEGAQYQEFNPQKARDFLAAAGYPDGFKTKLHTTTAVGPALQTESEFFAEELREVGIEAEFVIYPDGSAWYAGPRGGNMPDGLMYYYADSFYDPDPFFDVYKPGNVVRNLSHVQEDPPLLELIEKQRGAVDLAERGAIIDDIQRHTAVQLYYIVTVGPPQAAAWQPWFKNWRMFEGQDYGYSFLRSWVTV